MSRVAAISVLLAGVIAVNAVDVYSVGVKEPDLYLGRNGRVELKKPHGWHFQNIDDIELQAKLEPLRGDRFLRYLKESSGTLLVTATKYAEPTDAYNPSFQVYLLWNENPDSEAIALLERELERRFAQRVGYRVLETVATCEIAGLPAARALIGYNATSPNLKGLPLVSQLYLVSRGPYMYMFAFVGRPGGTDSLGTEVSEMLKSVRFLE